LNDVLLNKVYLIATYWTYPFGGGEEFMYDTMEWASGLGMKSYWIAFANSNNKTFERFEIIKHQYGTIIHVPGGFQTDTLTNWLYIIKPDIVHHQGLFREGFFMAVEEMRIEFLTGFHFWNGGITLDESKKNILMIENDSYHKTDPEFEILKTKKHCSFYCVSKYVQECFDIITKTHIPDIIYASSSVKRYLITNHDPWTAKYVTMINIHKNKGGDIFYYLLKNCPNIHMLCVRTEHHSEELDDLIKNEIEIRNKNSDCADCIFMERTSNVKEIYQQTKIILCTSFVDETFCRVANEAMMNSIPVLTTHRGNIKHLVGDTTPVLDPELPEDWINAINDIYYDETRYRKISSLMKSKYEEASEDVARKQFEQVVRKTVLKSKSFSIGIFAPWCDQGLGIQARNYYRILKESKLYNVVAIFAYKPYNADSCEALQKNRSEWITDDIYYSSNCRENVKDVEILEFCNRYNIGKMIIPETCWSRIFQIAKLLRELDIKAYAVPNIEIVRKDELYKHNYFYKILANNYLCERIFSAVLDIPVNYIGYGTYGIEFREKIDITTINLLFIGGMNAFSRKHVLDVCRGFIIAYESNNNLKLTVTIQMTNSLEDIVKSEIDTFKNHPGIRILQDHITYKEILDLYYTHHISIQVSKHEGLGLGFYEALMTGTPVITLNTPPHNEIVLDNINGWTIECFYKKMTDNPVGMFGSAYFDPSILATKIVEIASNKQEIAKIINSLEIDIKTRLSSDIFATRFLNEIM